MSQQPELEDQQTANLVKQFEQRAGYCFQNPAFLIEALTHSSSADNRVDSYERLEFLGDSILGFTVCEFLFHRFPDWLEGDLTKIKSNVVSRTTCAKIGRELKLDDFLVVGKGVGSMGKVPSSLLANAFESIVAAIYLDGGIPAAQDFLHPYVERHVEAAIAGQLSINYKSELQQYAQKRFGVPPAYKIVGNSGPDHEKMFRVMAQVSKKEFSPAWGHNKKQAEQRAAANALAEIAGLEPPFYDE